MPCRLGLSPRVPCPQQKVLKSLDYVTLALTRKVVIHIDYKNLLAQGSGALSFVKLVAVFRLLELLLNYIRSSGLIVYAFVESRCLR